jgi:hypothetical protein
MEEIDEKDNILYFENKEPFKALVITPNKIDGRDWSHPDYLINLANETFCTYELVNPNKEDYINFLHKSLALEEYTKTTNSEPYLKVQVIAEEENYVYEIMYIEMDQGPEKLLNEFATLLNINNDKIIGNAILTRSYISSTDSKMQLDNITPEIVESVLFNRAHTKVILYNSDNDEYEESLVIGSMDEFAELYFAEKKYVIKKKEISFLKHNLNIWYTEDTYGTPNVIGNLLPNINIDKAIIFSMWAEEFRDSISLIEFNKIKYLSNKLSDYTTPPEYEKEEKDEHGRNIIKNKYKVLNEIYNKFKS